MATRNVVLHEHQHEFSQTLVRSGHSQNASEVMREGLRLLEREETEDAATLAPVLRQAAEQGWADLALGRFDDIDDESLEGVILRLRAGPRQGRSVG